MEHENLLEKELDDLYKEAANGQNKGEIARKRRASIAYALKIIAAGGSLVVATGLVASWHQVIGIAILVAIFVDTVSSNHKRLIAEVEAGYAFRVLRSRVKGEFNREAALLQKRKQQGDEQADAALDELMNKAHIALSDGITSIQDKLEKADVSALQGLSLDQERSSLSKDPI